MPMMVLAYAAVLIFIVGNIYRVSRIARMPAHLRWELYPVPRGSRTQRRHGGSYFEESEWWTKHPEASHTSELAYIVREVLLLKGVWDEHGALWMWSWLMHLGLYSLVVAVAAIPMAALHWPGALVAVTVLAWAGTVTGWIGALGVLALRVISPRLRPYTSRGTILNLGLVGTVFGTGLAALIIEPAALRDMIAFCLALLRSGSGPALSKLEIAHIASIAVFLMYFPFTHMTHAYMKFFTYHSVRWDDAPSVHNPRAAEILVSNLKRPVTWSAAHIGSGEAKTWVDVVSSGAEQGRNA